MYTNRMNTTTSTTNTTTITNPYSKRGTQYKKLTKATTFLELCYKQYFKEACGHSGMNMNQDQIKNFFSNYKSVGNFCHYKECSLADNGHVYILVAHTRGDVQWILLVTEYNVAGWDIKFRGSYRLPTENNQKVIETLQSDFQLQQNGNNNRLSGLYHRNSSLSSNIWVTENSIIDKKVVRLTYQLNNINPSFFKRYPQTNNIPTLTLILPPNRPFQKHIAFFTTPTFHSVESSEINGNTYYYVSFGPNSVPRDLQYSIDLLMDSTPIDKQPNPKYYEWDLSNDDPNQYTVKSNTKFAVLDPFHPKVIEIRDKILGQNQLRLSQSPTSKKAFEIAKWVANVPYEIPPPGRGFPSLDDYLRDFRYVECGGHAILFTVLCRSAGIPARRLHHPWIAERNGKLVFDSHCIAEFYDNQLRSWVPVDATTGPFVAHDRNKWMRIPHNSSTVNGVCLTSESIQEQELSNDIFNQNYSKYLLNCNIEVFNYN
eukprot:gene7807-9610_t